MFSDKLVSSFDTRASLRSISIDPKTAKTKAAPAAPLGQPALLPVLGRTRDRSREQE